MALADGELETATIDLDAARRLQTGCGARVEAQQDAGQEAVQRRRRAVLDRVQPVQPEPRDALQDGQHPLPAHVGERVHGPTDRCRQVGALDEPGVLQFLESFGQEIRRDAGQIAAQVTVAARPADQLAQDQQCPPLAEDVEPARDRAVLVVVPEGCHGTIIPAADIFFQVLLDFLVS